MIGAIVLAAGQSRRMGTQKLLLPWGAKPLLAHVVDQVLAGPVWPVIVVVGRDAPAIGTVLAGRPVTLLANPRPQSEMLVSVRCGLRALSRHSEGVLVALGDQPGVTSELIGRLTAAFRSAPESIVVPQCQGRRGHPIVVPRRFFTPVFQRYEGVGLRGLLEEYPDDIVEVPIDHPQTLHDLDTPEDYRRLSGPW